MAMQGTFITPTGLFLVSMAVMYLVTAILHPQEFSMIIYGLMYFICIPSGYLLLTIYSLVNMHIVTWGTRETNKEKEEKMTQNVLCDRNCKLCCWDMKLQVTQETDNLLLQQLQQVVNPNTQVTEQVVKEQQANSKKEINNAPNGENNKGILSKSSDSKLAKRDSDSKSDTRHVQSISQRPKGSCSLYCLMQTFIKWSATSVVTFHNLVHSSDDSVDSIPKKESAYSSIEDDNEDDDNMLYDGSLYSGFTEEEREFVPQSGRWFSTWKIIAVTYNIKKVSM